MTRIMQLAWRRLFKSIVAPVMRELKITNAKLYEAEDEGEEELDQQRRIIEEQAES